MDHRGLYIHLSAYSPGGDDNVQDVNVESRSLLTSKDDNVQGR